MRIIVGTPSKLLFTALVLALGGCASTGNNNTTASPKPYTYEVKPGDSLGDIALSITGNVSDWQSIAQYNGIDDPKKLAAGVTIVIPNDLLPQDLKREVPDGATIVAEAQPLPAANNDIAEVTPSSTESEDQIAMFPVSVNRSFQLQPISKISTSNAIKVSNAKYDESTPMVRVLGTYYPKGIYAQPANYSQLLERVAPGTTFPLHSEVNEWYKIIIDDGFGYIRQNDSTLEP